MLPLRAIICKVSILDEIEKASLDVAIDVIMKKTSPKTIKIKDDIEINNLTCYRKSKDGLFMTHKEQLVA